MSAALILAGCGVCVFFQKKGVQSRVAHHKQGRRCSARSIADPVFHLCGPAQTPRPAQRDPIGVCKCFRQRIYMHAMGLRGRWDRAWVVHTCTTGRYLALMVSGTGSATVRVWYVFTRSLVYSDDGKHATHQSLTTKLLLYTYCPMSFAPTYRNKPTDRTIFGP